MNFTLQLTAEQISVIGKSLGAGVYAEVAPIIQAIQGQVDQQIQAQQAAAAQAQAEAEAPAKAKK